MYKGTIPFPNLDGSVTPIDNKEFDLSLKFLEEITPSKKAPDRKRYIFVDQNGVKFPMMSLEYGQFKAACNLAGISGTDFTMARWTFVKRGKQYGLRLYSALPGLDPSSTSSLLAAANAVLLGKKQTGVTAAPPAVTVAPVPTPAPTPPAPKVMRRTTLFALCLDSSQSMSSIKRETTVAAVNLTVKSIRDAAEANKQTAKVMLWEFGVDGSTRHFDGVKISRPLVEAKDFKDFTMDEYVPRGNTPLFKCVGEAIEFFQKLPENKDEEVSFLVHSITDGQENMSQYSRFPVPVVTQMMADAQKTDRWTFAFQVPIGEEKEFSSMYGIPQGNVQGWVTTDKGIQAAAIATSDSMDSFMTSRSVGMRSTKTVYTTNLSKVSIDDLKSKLTDVSGSVRFMKVEKEAEVKEFAEEKTKTPYVLGSIWYALTKPETLRHDKGIMIRVKSTKTVYAGPETRQLLGIDPTSKDDSKVIPGNHSDYEIYVQSGSINRLLVRGTDVIYMIPLTPLKETWDSEAAKKAAEAKKAQSGQPVTP